ncbi:hypothetical protein ABZX93_04515 [Streptomyces sp. NPDC006632]|uniref:hypothetical protein n=1 Tax=Streptomyces sp. NPDC006632 TaxID=3157182 RepID=UPI0033A0B338
MRQLTTPARLAELAVTVLVLTASAGCMSVSDEEGRPRPSVSAGQHGEAAARPDEGKGGVSEGKGRTGKHDPKASGAASGPARPSGSSAPGAATPSAGGHPKPGGGTGGSAKPSQGASQPAPTPTHSDPPPPPASPSPPPVPTPPPASPSTTPGADTHNSAMRRNQAPIDQEPSASPQVGPV